MAPRRCTTDARRFLPYPIWTACPNGSLAVYDPSQNEDRATEFARVFPEYVHLDCSDQDTLWLEPFDSANGQMGRGPLWLRVTSEGKMESVEFPVSFRPMRFHVDRIWGIHAGEFNVEYLAWTELIDD